MHKGENTNNSTLDAVNNDSHKTLKKIIRIIFGRTIPQIMFRIYLVIIFLGAGLLYCSFSLKNGYVIITDPLSGKDSRNYSFFDALFIACSGFSDTGLTPAVISETFTPIAQVIIMILIEVGGIGVLSLFFFFWNLFRKSENVSLKQMTMLQAERGNEKLGNSYKMVRNAILFIFVSQLAFGFIYSFWMCFVPAYEQTANSVGASGPTYDNGNLLNCYHNYGLSLWIGMFTSVSAINNAGFDIFQGTSSLSSYRNDWHTIFQLLILLEIIIGGIGYPVIFDVLEKRKNARKGIQSKTSLFTKIALWFYFIVAVAGLIFAYSFEAVNATLNTDSYSIFTDKNLNHEFGRAKTFNEIWCVFFNSMVTRSAGFSTISHSLFSSGTKWTNCALMFIGGSPSSTAGGIRTTTFAIVVIAIFNKALGKNRVSIFKRTIPEKKVKDSFIVLVTAAVLILFFSILITYTQINQSQADEFNFLDVLYEAASAFGTVGLSVGLTASIMPFGQILLILLMFIGQLGVSSTLLSWTRRNPKGNLAQYPEEDVRIG